MRGGAAGGVSSGGAVFRVRRVADLALLAVQWALILQGIALLLIAVQVYHFDLGLMQAKTGALPGQDTYRIPIHQRLVVGTTTGTIALGLGALLFYLRRLYLSRRK